MYALQCDPAKPIAISVNEIEQFFGCCFFMSIYGLPRTEMYWNLKTRVSAVADTMSRTRWREIKSKIHFSRNLQANATNNAEVTDSLQKIRHILDKLIIPFKGRYRLKNYMPKKPKKWGYKAFLLCDSSGLIYNFEIYTGKVIRDPELPNVGSSDNVVLRLAKIIPKQLFYKICFDNWFLTLPLVTELEKLGIQSVATVRSNRLKNCEFSSDKVMKTKGRGSYEILSTSIDRVTINAIKWYDNKAVHLMSTFCEVEPVDIVKSMISRVKHTHCDIFGLVSDSKYVLKVTQHRWILTDAKCNCYAYRGNYEATKKKKATETLTGTIFAKKRSAVTQKNKKPNNSKKSYSKRYNTEK
ncbi:piggyBac transposable element-derived protein 3-like [Vespa mandarinia]|uniref:piggyBac transposable element-derived protein 3-like n=1 Tax=Vespa mandarinia TaxID=7446 RepID=UPI001613C559|nr:piggyBac transposable element-derived protein 3-like [Vespa mandarinia]